jgi:hypothetical protein
MALTSASWSSSTTQETISAEFVTARLLKTQRGTDCVTADLIAKVFPVSNRFRQPGDYCCVRL